MIYAPVEKYGIDKGIYNIQEALYNIMLSDDCKWTDIHLYGRIYKTETETGGRPEIYTKNRNYKPVFVNDTKGAEIGFYVTGRDFTNRVDKASIRIIFTTNLEKLQTKRNDEYILQQAKKWLISTNMMLSFGAINTGINDVFSDFETEQIKYRDMHPFFVFSFDVEITHEGSVC